MIKIICIGKLKEKYFQDACCEYQKRLEKYTKLEIIELADEKSDDDLRELVGEEFPGGGQAYVQQFAGLVERERPEPGRRKTHALAVQDVGQNEQSHAPTQAGGNGSGC